MAFGHDRRRTRTLLSFFAAAAILAAVPVHAQYKKQGKNKADRQMSGIVSSVETTNGMMTMRLDNGDLFSAPVGIVKVRDMRQSASATKAATTNAGKPPVRRRGVAVSSSESVPVGSRVVVRRKLDKDGNLKRVVVRIVEQ